MLGCHGMDCNELKQMEGLCQAKKEKKKEESCGPQAFRLVRVGSMI